MYLSRILVSVTFLAIAAAGLLSCGPVGTTVNDDAVVTDPDGANTYICNQRPGQTICDGNSQVICNADGSEQSRMDCGGLTCVDGAGCVICHPGQTFCNGNLVMQCRADLMGYEDGYTCDPNAGETCDPDEGGCVNLCTLASERKANVGCDYIAVDMANVDEFTANDSCFVVIVSNVQPEGEAVVTVVDDASNLLDFPGVGTEWHIAPQELAVIPITGNAGECSLTPARPNATNMNSGLQPGSTFRVKSTLPVVAYQINPYEAANKHTTDAALLIPVPALGDQYRTANFEGYARSEPGYPSSISIVAVEDNTVVTVAPANTVAAGGVVPGGAAPFDVTMNANEHLQVVSTTHLDLMGSAVTATAPVAVFSGDLCSDVPIGMGYCDHLEEQMPPVSAWGLQYVAAVPPRRGSENALWRIMAAVEGTQILVDPYSQYNRTLAAGEVMEIDEPDSFMITATSGSPDPTQDPRPIMVVNFLKGAEQTAQESGTTIDALGNQRGDPAMTLSVPIEQYLDSYVFLADPSYAYNYVVVVRTDQTVPVHLDCLDPINTFQPIIGTPFERAEVKLKSESGTADGTCGTSGDVHYIWSEAPFGIWVYGYYSDTSYGYPGGMNLEQINDVVIIVE